MQEQTEKLKVRDEDYTLLMRISDKVDTLIDTVGEMKAEMKNRVHLEDFNRLEKEVEKIRTSQDGINLKMAWFAGAVAVITFIANKMF